MELGEIGSLGSPVILLKIYIGGVVAAPWRGEFFIPKSLQVCRDGRGARACYEKIASELEVEFL